MRGKCSCGRKEDLSPFKLCLMCQIIYDGNQRIKEREQSEVQK